jgi:hypothetical protein
VKLRKPGNLRIAGSLSSGLSMSDDLRERNLEGSRKAKSKTSSQKVRV